jgi:hypothetical protein
MQANVAANTLNGSQAVAPPGLMANYRNEGCHAHSCVQPVENWCLAPLFHRFSTGWREFALEPVAAAFPSWMRRAIAVTAFAKGFKTAVHVPEFTLWKTGAWHQFSTGWEAVSGAVRSEDKL